VQAQADQIAELHVQLAELRRHLDRVEASSGAPPTDVPATDRDRRGADAGGADAGDDARVDRRVALQRAGVLAATAVAGGAAAVLATASPAAAVTGTFSGNPAVSATGIGGPGVTATTNTGSAIAASTNNNADAISGVNPNSAGTGVYGTGGNVGVDAFCSGVGPGLRGVGSTGVGLELRTGPTGAAHLYLNDSFNSLPVPTGRVDFHQAGEIAMDQNHDLWFCAVAGSPGTWRRLAGPTTTGALTLITPAVRVYDSRPGLPPLLGTKTPLAGGVARTVDLKANGSGVPAGAAGVLVSLTATGTTGAAGGFLTIYRNGISWPGTSNVNWWGPSQVVAVTTVTTVDAAAQCALYANVPTDVVVDVLGYYR
jgi:hypothetical protein